MGQKLYSSLEERQADLDEWLLEYTWDKSHNGKYCYGKTPMQTFLDRNRLAGEKMLDQLLEVTQPSRTRELFSVS